jgi:hypothetical protein
MALSARRFIRAWVLKSSVLERKYNVRVNACL